MSDYHHHQSQNQNHQQMPDDPARMRASIADLERDHIQLQQQVARALREREAAEQSLERLQAEYRQMQEEQRRWRALLETSSEFIGMVTLEGRPLYLNQTGRRLVGLESEEQFQQTTIMDYVYPDDREQVQQQILPVLLAQGRWEGELRFRHFQREAAIPVWYSAFLVRDMQTGEPLALGTVTRDLTIQKQHEEQVRLAHFTLEHAADGIQWLNRQGQHTYVNAALCRWLGYTQDEMLTMKVPDIHPDVPADAWDAAWNEVKQHGARTFETRQRAKDGTLVPVEVTANYINFNGTEYICSVVRDTTERQRAEDALRTFSALVNHSPGAIGLAAITGEITYANTAFRTLTGYGDALVGMQFAALYPEDERPAVVAAAQQAQQGAWEGLLTMQRRDGIRVPVRASSFVLHDAAGHPQFLAGIFQDLTEVQQAEAERTALQQQIIAAQQQALHELSTPLIPLSDNVVVMPIIGTVDSARAQQILETLLTGVAQHQAASAILDITGVRIVDTQVASALIRAAQAVRLLGAQVILTGIRPDVAQTLVHLGVDLRGIGTYGSLQAGIAAALAHRTSSNGRPNGAWQPHGRP
ncbi:MAG: PAS domain S-box protein [Chloroflexaceae bacterium]